MRVEERPAHAKRKRKKRESVLTYALKLVILVLLTVFVGVGRLIRTYALQIGILILVTVMVVLMVCGVLYIREHLGHSPDREPPPDNTDDIATPEPPAIPTEPVIPETVESPEATVIPSWIVQDILPINDYSRPGIELSEVNGVVVHYTGNPGTTAEQNRSYFGNLAETKETHASSHFVIGIDGKIIQCVPLNEIAYCSNQRNEDTVSIECCHSDDTGQFSQATLDSLIQLLNWLIKIYDLSRDEILRHYDVMGKECPYYFVKHPDAWERLLNSLNYV